MINAVLRDTQRVTTDTDESLNAIVRDLKDSGLIQKPTDWIVLYKLLSEQKIRMTMREFTELVGDERVRVSSLFSADFVTDKRYPNWQMPQRHEGKALCPLLRNSKNHLSTITKFGTKIVFSYPFS